MRTPDGRPINAARGLLDFLARFISEYDPQYVACCWDDDWRPTWRVDLVSSYKEHRVAETTPDGWVEEVPADLTAQVPWIVEILDAVGLARVGAPDYEADDIMATLAASAPGPVDVVTGDRDMFQLVDDDAGVRVLYVARGVARHERVTDAWLAAKYGIVGAQYVDFATMRGDASDGLPGVKGIGEKTAAGLLARYGDLEGILAHADQLSAGQRRALAEGADYLGRAARVVACDRHVNLPDFDLSRPRKPRDPERLACLDAELGLGSSLQRLLDALAG